MNNIRRHSVFTQTEDYNLTKSEANQFVDIYDLFNVLYELFEDLGVLAKDVSSRDKISFKFSYPFQLYENNENIVTFDIGQRKPAEISGRKQIGSIQKVTKKDIVSGQLEYFHERYMSNIINITVYSTTYKELISIVKYLENVFYKHKGRLKQYVKNIELEQVSNTFFNENSASQRMYSKTISLNVMTIEINSLLHEEIQEINIEN